jgi:hypothetical protein
MFRPRIQAPDVLKAPGGKVFVDAVLPPSLPNTFR